MDRAQFVVSMIKFRLTHHAIVALGAPRAMAEYAASDFIKSQGLTGFFGTLKARSTPEGAILHMVETYCGYYNKNIRFDKTNGDTTKRWAASIIENNRARMVPGTAQYPHELHEYILYRTKLEVEPITGIPPEVLGLSDPVILQLTEAAKNFTLGKPFSLAA